MSLISLLKPIKPLLFFPSTELSPEEERLKGKAWETDFFPDDDDVEMDSSSESLLTYEVTLVRSLTQPTAFFCTLYDKHTVRGFRSIEGSRGMESIPVLRASRAIESNHISLLPPRRRHSPFNL